MSEITTAVPFLGFQAALSVGDTEPVTADLLGRINTVGDLSVEMNYIDTTSVSSLTGYTESTPLLKTVNEVPLTIFYNKAGYDKLREAFEKNELAGDSILYSLTIFYPTRSGSDARTNYRYRGFLTRFEESAVGVDDVQKFSLTFKPTGAPVATTKKIVMNVPDDSVTIGDISGG